MRTIKHIISHYTAFLWSILKPLGPWGVFLAAALDGAAFGLPIDIVVSVYVSQNHALLPVYVVMAAAGSALGSVAIYAIGYTGGEEVLRKRVSPERFQKLHAAFDEHPFWSLMFPAMLPPPTPFKLFVLAAGVTEMSWGHFLTAIFFGRAIRFLALALLVVRFGPSIVNTLGSIFTHHFYWVPIVAAAGFATWLVIRRRSRRPAAEVVEQ